MLERPGHHCSVPHSQPVLTSQAKEGVCMPQCEAWCLRGDRRNSVFGLLGKQCGAKQGIAGELCSKSSTKGTSRVDVTAGKPDVVT